MNISSLSQWNPGIKVWTFFSLLNVIRKSLKFSHWPSKYQYSWIIQLGWMWKNQSWQNSFRNLTPNVSGFCYCAVVTKRAVFRLECALSTVGHMMSQGFLLLHNWSLNRSDQQENVCPTDSSPAPNQDYRDISWQLSSSDRRVANILGRSMVDASSTCTPLTYPMKCGSRPSYAKAYEKHWCSLDKAGY